MSMLSSSEHSFHAAILYTHTQTPQHGQHLLQGTGTGITCDKVFQCIPCMAHGPHPKPQLLTNGSMYTQCGAAADRVIPE